MSDEGRPQRKKITELIGELGGGLAGLENRVSQLQNQMDGVPSCPSAGELKVSTPTTIEDALQYLAKRVAMLEEQIASVSVRF